MNQVGVLESRRACGRNERGKDVTPVGLLYVVVSIYFCLAKSTEMGGYVFINIRVSNLIRIAMEIQDRINRSC